jgi:UDP-N-acetylglucosamine 2-epimerase (non-hydrolysing)
MTDVNIVFGTRPEAIKLAPVIQALKSKPGISFRVILTGQHREMTKGILDWFDIVPDADLDIMEKDQSLASMTARCVTLVDKYFAANPSKIVLAQGDTTSAFIASLVGFYHKSKIGHVEAGLRTGNKYSPWPEEMNRLLVTQLADFHFAPTQKNVQSLLKENINPDTILQSGNTVIDALLYSVKKIKIQHRYAPSLHEFYKGDKQGAKVILITGHRRENFGGGFENICNAIRTLAEKYPDAHFVYPVHLNPNVRKTVFDMLGNSANIHLIEPLEYPEFVSLMERSFMILTDSGGVQEEAPSLKKPVLVFRENTERPEAVDAGMVKIVGVQVKNIIDSFVSIYENPAEYNSMIQGVNPYGDGTAAKKIVDFLEKQL